MTAAAGARPSRKREEERVDEPVVALLHAERPRLHLDHQRRPRRRRAADDDVDPTGEHDLAVGQAHVDRLLGPGPPARREGRPARQQEIPSLGDLVGEGLAGVRVERLDPLDRAAFSRPSTRQRSSPSSSGSGSGRRRARS